MEKEVKLSGEEGYGYGFVPAEYLPAGKDEYWLRNAQSGVRPWRALTADEIDSLKRNGNSCSAWDRLLVCDPFEPERIKNSSFYGLVRLGAVTGTLLVHHDFHIPAGIRNSTIISCDIGGNTAIQDCVYLSHYIIGDECILSRIDELSTSNHAKFGEGILKEGEDEEVRVRIDVMNEAGGRSILPFAAMLPADAYLWAAYRDDTALLEKLEAITQKGKEKRGAYGVIGSGTVIKSCRIIKDVAVGGGAYIKGANKLKNLTILSSGDESTQIGEGVELVNGIIGCGSRIFYGSKAVRFVIGRRCNLKYGARLIHSVLGDNSTVSCCEILNNLVFPVHEQHHNNSFLIAALIGGMSNMAAGATIGSNHNSRANDGEIRAGRGFWPGLSVTIKHSSRFASFCLIVKGDYPYELDISLPFALVNNNVRLDRLEVMPAYFWMYNLYALERNSWKTRERDRRRVKEQRIEADYLAPDTAEEIITALEKIEDWMARAGISPLANRSEQTDAGEEDPEYDVGAAEREEALPAYGLERHTRPAVILKPREAAAAYREMLFYYGMKELAAHADATKLSPGRIIKRIAEQPSGGPGGRVRAWVNLGGMITPAWRVDDLRDKLRTGKISGWEAVHAVYDEMASSYPEDKIRHAFAVLGYLGVNLDSPENIAAALDRLAALGHKISGQVLASRAKDFHDPFRSITYRNEAEMRAVAGTGADNAFVRLAREKAGAFAEMTARVSGLP